MATKITPRKIRRYGWRRSLPDVRDLRFSAPPTLLTPPSVDLSGICPPIMDQGNLGSCVAQGVTAAMRANRMSQGLTDVRLSRLQLYYDGRAAEGTLGEDSGLEIRTGIKCAAKIGVADESLWPYRISRFKYKPPARVYAAAKANEALKYMAVQQYMASIKAALAMGHLVVIGIAVYESFESQATTKTGAIQMPGTREKQFGGHCMYLYGYDDTVDASRARGINSWGEGWGDKGRFTIPWDYLCNTSLAADFWVVQNVG